MPNSSSNKDEVIFVKYESEEHKLTCLTEEHCSGFCPAGYQCAWNTTIPKQCPPGHYSSGGWAFCVACPRSKGTESHQTCRTGRKCCNM